MAIHNEAVLEAEICADLGARGWLYTPPQGSTLSPEVFAGEIDPHDKLIYVNNVIKGKLLDCELLVQQAIHSTKEQFADSPDLDRMLQDAVMDALSSFTEMSKQALQSAQTLKELKDVLLGPAGLYEALRERGSEV